VSVGSIAFIAGFMFGTAFGFLVGIVPIGETLLEGRDGTEDSD